MLTCLRLPAIRDRLDTLLDEGSSREMNLRELSTTEVARNDQLRMEMALRQVHFSYVQRAQIVLGCGAGETNTAIAKRMGVTGMSVGKWRRSDRELGLEGLHDELRSGRPRTFEDDQVAEVINRARQNKPDPMAAPIGVLVRWPLPPVSPQERCTGGCKPSRYSPIGRNVSSFRAIRSLTSSLATSSACT